MSQPSTTAVSRFQFRNRLSFQEYSSFAHKSDFLSKTFFRFLSNRNSRIPLKDDSATQITLGRAPCGCVLAWRMHRALLLRSYAQGTDDLPGTVLAWSPPTRPQLVRENTETLRLRVVGNNFLNQSKCDILILSYAWVFWAAAVSSQWLTDRRCKTALSDGWLAEAKCVWYEIAIICIKLSSFGGN